MRAPDPALLRDLGRVVGPKRVLARPIDRLGRSADASIYRLVPEVVVRPRDLAQVRGLLTVARRHRRGLTFRTAGTSLSGQAVTDQILVELAHDWGRFEIRDGGGRVWSQPGVVGGLLNRRLAPFARRLGSDPASIDACMIGGIVANNSSGMCCGTEQNAYRMLESMTLALADGTVVDTAGPDADERLSRARPGLHGALLRMRDQVRGDGALVERIRRRFALKNTTGYRLDALLDHDRPAQILAHLLVGSQGTLGFVADVTLRTVPDPPLRATALLYFAELRDAGAAVAPLTAAGAVAQEIMDAASLRSQAEDRAHPFAISDRTAALLVEMRESDQDGLDAAVARALQALDGRPLLVRPEFTRDPAERDDHWRLRKGLFPAVGGMRPPGTAVVIEDVAVPPARLAEAIDDLRALFVRHGFDDAIVFGHARDGNLHFVFARDFARPDVVAAYDAFMRELATMVTGRYDGSLKAEHGSGRNMAPFVREEWGDQAYALMWRIKRLLDPDGILNPGVVLSHDPEAHLRHLKPLTIVSPLVDKCIECGFCEPRCPSRDLTLSPRQRIVAAREIERLLASPSGEDRALARSLREDYEYEGVATCAGDSMCKTSCPVKIDTGLLIKEIRSRGHSSLASGLASVVSSHMGAATAAARGGLRAAAMLGRVPGGSFAVEAISALGHRIAPDMVPYLPQGTVLGSAASAARPPRTQSTAIAAVFFPTCLTRVFASDPPGAPSLSELLGAAGFAVRMPPGMAGLCCGMPFGSKGFTDAAQQTGARALDALWHASDEGRLPIVTDASPCAGTLQERSRLDPSRPLRILDFPSFWAAEGLARRPPGRRKALAVVHPTCTLVKNGGLPDLLAVARACAEEVLVPAAAECCGFAGDKGFLVPEVTEAATRREAAEVREALAGREGELYSTCRTCEIGMTRAVGRPCRSLVQLVAETLG